MLMCCWWYLSCSAWKIKATAQKARRTMSPVLPRPLLKWMMNTINDVKVHAKWYPVSIRNVKVFRAMVYGYTEATTG